MVGVLETGHMHLLGMVYHGFSVSCVGLSPLSLSFSSAKWMLVTHYFEDQWSSNPCGHIEVFSCWVSARSTGPAYAPCCWVKIASHSWVRSFTVELSVSPLSEAAVFVWQCCCYPALAVTRNRVFMCGEGGGRGAGSEIRCTLVFSCLFGQALWQFSLRSFQGPTMISMPSKEHTTVLSFYSGFSMFFVMSQVHYGPSGNTWSSSFWAMVKYDVLF